MLFLFGAEKIAISLSFTQRKTHEKKCEMKNKLKSFSTGSFLLHSQKNEKKSEKRVDSTMRRAKEKENTHTHILVSAQFFLLFFSVDFSSLFFFGKWPAFFKGKIKCCHSCAPKRLVYSNHFVRSMFIRWLCSMWAVKWCKNNNNNQVYYKSTQKKNTILELVIFHFNFVVFSSYAAVICLSLSLVYISIERE